ncbi:unnamed protein product [Linum trigynum]|uniref:Uncharacterized protein n=1 Tax=Linum trigynum TaxID=586398 RepID=A0AAV2CRM3_9ROSI
MLLITKALGCQIFFFDMWGYFRNPHIEIEYSESSSALRSIVESSEFDVPSETDPSIVVTQQTLCRNDEFI